MFTFENPFILPQITDCTSPPPFSFLNSSSVKLLPLTTNERGGQGCRPPLTSKDGSALIDCNTTMSVNAQQNAHQCIYYCSATVWTQFTTEQFWGDFIAWRYTLGFFFHLWSFSFITKKKNNSAYLIPINESYICFIRYQILLGTVVHN